MTDTQTLEIVNVLKTLPSEKVAEVKKFAFSLQDKNKETPAQLLAKIAELPLENEDELFSGRDHDKILYGEK
jgi:phosphoribosylformylglycinamidine (FGAM) synthase PurS component